MKDLQSEPYPFVTIIMPIRNEAAFIKRSLASVLAQDYPPNRMEVLIVDGKSTDGTRDIVTNLKIRNPKRCPEPVEGSEICILDNPARIVPTALNIGLQHACGSVIIRVDGHCEIAPDYVRRCVEVLQEIGADCVGGPMVTVGETWMAQAVALAQSSSFGVGGVAFRTGRTNPGYVDTLAFGAYRREVFEQIGGFDEQLVRNQDDEFNYRLLKAGGRIWLDPSIHSVYHSRASLRSLWRQYFQYGYWKVRVMQKHPRQMHLRQFVPPTFVAALLGSALLATFTVVGCLLLTLIAGSYILANLAASVWTACKHGWRHLLRLPAVFVTLHLSYGLGFLIRLVRFAARGA
jgi:succinoglycan biosynthesis protein ExoA